jgi:PAS domain S-box-containing protein
MVFKWLSQCASLLRKRAPLLIPAGSYICLLTTTATFAWSQIRNEAIKTRLDRATHTTTTTTKSLETISKIEKNLVSYKTEKTLDYIQLNEIEIAKLGTLAEAIILPNDSPHRESMEKIKYSVDIIKDNNKKLKKDSPDKDNYLIDSLLDEIENLTLELVRFQLNHKQVSDYYQTELGRSRTSTKLIVVISLALNMISLAVAVNHLVNTSRTLNQTKQIAKQSSFIVDAIIANIIDGVLTLDNTGKILQANNAIETTFRYRVNELINKPITILLTDPNAQQTWIPHWFHPEKNAGLKQQLHGYTKEGILLHLEASISKLDNILIAIIRDVGVYKEHTKMLEDKANELKQINSNLEQEKKRVRFFVAHITHDLRTPVVAAGMVYRLYKNGSLGETSPQMLEAIEKLDKSNTDLLEIINNLLDIHQYEAGEKPLKKNPVDIYQIASDVVQEVEAISIQKKLELSISLHTARPEQLLVLGDNIELKRAITNLVGNALKFTYQGFVVIQLESTPNQVIVAVKDSGRGIAPDELEKVFERFHKSNYETVGNGLGLHLVNTIVKQHNGQMEVKSELGSGSTFTMILPRYNP